MRRGQGRRLGGRGRGRRRGRERGRGGRGKLVQNKEDKTVIRKKIK